LLEMKVGAISKKEVGEMKRTLLWCIFSLALIVALLSALAPQSLAALKNVGIIKGDFAPTAGIIKGDFAPTAGIIKGDFAPTAGIIKGDFAPTA